MPRQPNVLRLATRDVRNARKVRDALEEGKQACHTSQADLRLTIMQTRIRLAEVMATLRRISSVMDA